MIREEVDPSLEEEEEDKDEERFDDTLMEVVQLNSKNAIIDSRSNSLGPSFYH